MEQVNGGPPVLLWVAAIIAALPLTSGPRSKWPLSLCLFFWFGLGALTGFVGIPVPFPKPVFLAMLLLAAVVASVVFLEGIRKSRTFLMTWTETWAYRLNGLNIIIPLIGFFTNL